MKNRSNVICAKLAYMNSLALSVGASNNQLESRAFEIRAVQQER